MGTLARCLTFCASISPFVKWSKYLPHRVVVRIKMFVKILTTLNMLIKKHILSTSFVYM